MELKAKSIIIYAAAADETLDYIKTGSTYTINGQ
jgi:hypothetical protein